jgi:hypothetical protein
MCAVACHPGASGPVSHISHYRAAIIRHARLTGRMTDARWRAGSGMFVLVWAALLCQRPTIPSAQANATAHFGWTVFFLYSVTEGRLHLADIGVAKVRCQREPALCNSCCRLSRCRCAAGQGPLQLLMLYNFVMAFNFYRLSNAQREIAHVGAKTWWYSSEGVLVYPMADKLVGPLRDLGITPNFITIANIPVGTYMAWTVATSQWQSAFFLCYVHQLLDGMDGTMARRYALQHGPQGWARVGKLCLRVWRGDHPCVHALTQSRAPGRFNMGTPMGAVLDEYCDIICGIILGIASLWRAWPHPECTVGMSSLHIHGTRFARRSLIHMACGAVIVFYCTISLMGELAWSTRDPKKRIVRELRTLEFIGCGRYQFVVTFTPTFRSPVPLVAVAGAGWAFKGGVYPLASWPLAPPTLAV